AGGERVSRVDAGLGAGAGAADQPVVRTRTRPACPRVADGQAAPQGPLGHAAEAVREAGDHRVHGPLVGSAALLCAVPRHSPLAREKTRLAQELPALALP